MATTILSKKIVHQSVKVPVSQVELRLENGLTDTWERVEISDLVFGIPLTEDGKVMLVEEWRLDPERPLISITGARYTGDNDKKELARELKEEMGLIGGNHSLLIDGLSNGPHIAGFKRIYIVENFEITQPERDSNEILKVLTLPIKGLFDELLHHHCVTAETLLVAKMLEEKVTHN